MKMRLYCIYDKLAKECGPLFEAKNNEVARRAYKQFMEKSSLQASEEFALFYVGMFDKEAIELKPEKACVVNLEYGEVEENA